MRRNDQRRSDSLLEDQKREERKERIKRARERLKSGYYLSTEVVSFLAERLAMAKD